MELSKSTAFKVLKTVKKITNNQADVLKEVYENVGLTPPEGKELVDIKLLGDHFKVDLVKCVASIKERYLHSEPTRRFIIETFPEKAIADKKVKDLVLPSFLRELLSKEDREEIKRLWINRYSLPISKRGFKVIV